jgi:diadenosine tetraphosphate (Ap4A) HIT family hydrolase
MFRHRKAEKNYFKNKDVGFCPFCKPLPEYLVKETAHSFVVKSMFPYEMWEFRDVTEHLLIVPKRHVPSLSDLTDEERYELMDLMSEYELKEYNIYARSTKSVQRTIPLHQHTHLFKTDTKRARVALYVKKPYIVAKI